MTRRHFILATAGHVDHGKSSLVKALTGIDPDRLPEEKARGITIELGFANLELIDQAAGSHEACTHALGLVDVPGHEDFVKNMVAGVGSIDLALLVVAADDGWMPQTEEHLQILEYLGVRRGVVALTKSDLVEGIDATTAAIRERLHGSALAEAPIVATSIVTQSGFKELRAALLAVLRAAPSPRDQQRPRLAVDRAFTLRGLGTIVTGTLSGGRLKAGQEVRVQPGGLSARIRSLHSHGRQLEEALPGMRTALNLPEVPLAAAGQPGVARGDVVTAPDVGVVASTWNVRLQRSGRSAATGPGAPAVLKSGVQVQVHHGSACHPARALLLETAGLRPGESGVAQLRFDHPVCALAGDRFVVRDWSERATLAGGVVLEPAASRETKRSPEALELLRGLHAALERPAQWITTRLEALGVAPQAALEQSAPAGADEFREALRQLMASGQVLAVGASLAGARGWREHLGAARETIVAFHRASPEKPGLPVADLRSQFSHFDDSVFAALLAGLERAGCVRSGALIRSRDHTLKLPPELEAAGRRIRRLLAEKPMEPPSRKELAPDAAAQKALRFLIDNGEGVDLGSELVLAASAYQHAVALVTQHLRRAGEATVSELRPVLGTSRRILIPLLEHLDKARVTVRLGDKRRLAPDR